MIVVMLMVMAVDALLLFASGRFLGCRAKLVRVLAAAFLDGVLSVLSLLPEWPIGESMGWQIAVLLLTGLIAFGLDRSAVPRILLFILLRMSLGGISGGQIRFFSLLLGAAGMGFACLMVEREKTLIPIELTYGSRTLRLTALRDTGHSLRDPITGKHVLIVDAEAAQKLTGLDQTALRDPIKHMQSLPGLRLIPYKTVGNSGFLLALQIREAKIGNRQESTLVAFSPNLLGNRYQALTGGNL